MTRPTALPEWASAAAAADIIEPPAGRKASGYNLQGEKPSRQHLNWLLRQLYRWVQYFSEEGATPRYDTLLDVVQAQEAGELAAGATVVLAADPTREPWSTTWSATATSNVVRLAADGAALYVGYANGDLKAFNAYNGAELWTKNLIGASVEGLCTRGDRIWWSHGTSLIYSTPVDGVGVTTITLTGGKVATRLTTDGTHLYAACATGELRAWLIATGAQVWENTDLVGETINALATNGSRLAAALDYDAGGAARSVMVLNADTGVRTHWTSVDSGSGPDHGTALAFDAAGVLCLGSAQGATGGVYLIPQQATPLISPPPLLSTAFGGPVRDLAITADFLAVIDAADRLLVYPRHGAGPALYVFAQTTAVSGGYAALTADPTHLFVGGLQLTDHANARLQAFAQPQRPRVVTVVDVEGRYRGGFHGRWVG